MSFAARRRKGVMATKERLAAMAASRCAVCSAAMNVRLVAPDPRHRALELRTYACTDAATVKRTASRAVTLMDDIAQKPQSRPAEKTEPSCSRCGGATDLIRIEPAWRHYERHILESRECGQSDSYTR